MSGLKVLDVVQIYRYGIVQRQYYSHTYLIEYVAFKVIEQL